MAVNRAVSSHLDRVGLTRASVTGTTMVPLGRVSLWTEVDELTST